MSKKPDPVDVHVGARLRERRVGAGISQKTLGSAMGVTFQQIQKYENGLNRIGSSRLQQAAKVLGVRIDYFFEGGFMPAVESGFLDEGAMTFEGGPVSSETQRLLDAFSRIGDPETRSRLVLLVESMVDPQKRSS